jgi:hypothetical protein
MHQESVDKLYVLLKNEYFNSNTQKGWEHCSYENFAKIFPLIENKINAFQTKCQAHLTINDEAWNDSVIRDIAEIHW